MDGHGRLAGAYVRPCITDYGTLTEMTADGGTLQHVGIGIIAQASNPIVPGGGGGPGLTTETPEGVLGQNSGGSGSPGGEVAGSGGGGTGGGGGGSGGGSGGGGGGELPFTGFAVSAIGAIGAGLSAAGLALRERLRRN